jgi:hypothetical protein
MHDLVIFIGSAIFSSGIAWGAFKRLQKDVNAIGRKINEGEKDALRRHHNVSMVLILVAPSEKEREIVELMKES